MQVKTKIGVLSCAAFETLEMFPEQSLLLLLTFCMNTAFKGRKNFENRSTNIEVTARDDATNSSFYAHCFDASRWSRATFCFDFILTIKLCLVLAQRCCCKVGGANYIKPSRFILGIKQRIFGVDIPTEILFAFSSFFLVFSLFSIVNFRNDPCVSSSSIASGSTNYRNGTCYTSTQE